MRVGVLSVNQTAYDRPSRYISKSAAEGFVRKLTHERISKLLIREVIVKATPSSNPTRFSNPVPKLDIVTVPAPQLKPPSPPTTLNLFYPVRDMTSFAARNLQSTWGCEKEEWKRRIGIQ